MPKTISRSSKSQIDKFKETAKQVETDDREETFDRALKKVAGTTSHRPSQAHPKKAAK